MILEDVEGLDMDDAKCIQFLLKHLKPDHQSMLLHFEIEFKGKAYFWMLENVHVKSGFHIIGQLPAYSSILVFLFLKMFKEIKARTI